MATGAEIFAASAGRAAIASIGAFAFGGGDRNTTPESREATALALLKLGKGQFAFDATARAAALKRLSPVRDQKPAIPAPVPRQPAGTLPPGTRGFGTSSPGGLPEREILQPAGWASVLARIFRVVRTGEIIRRRTQRTRPRKQTSKQTQKQTKQTNKPRDPRFKRNRPFERSRETRPEPKPPQPKPVPTRPTAIPGRVTVADPAVSPDLDARPQAQPQISAPSRVPGRVQPGIQAPPRPQTPPKPVSRPVGGSTGTRLGRIAGTALATVTGALIGSRLAPATAATAARAAGLPAQNPSPAVATDLAVGPSRAEALRARSGRRLKCREQNCEKRRRKNRRTCREGFFRETSKKTEFTTWRRYICGTNITIMEK